MSLLTVYGRQLEWFARNVPPESDRSTIIVGVAALARH